MPLTDERRAEIFRRTDGYCHICGKKLCINNYGLAGRRGAWEVEHSVPRAEGGTDHPNNLYAACVACNRKKGTRSTRAARAVHGRGPAPLSAAKKAKRRIENAVVSAAAGGIGAVVLGLSGPAAWVAATISAAIGHGLEPDPQKGQRRR